MKKITTLVLAFLTVTVSFSQVFNTEISERFQKENAKDIYSIVFPSAYGFMTLHHLDNVMMDNTKAMVLTKYDQGMSAIETKTFNLPKLGLRAADLQEVIEIGDQLIFLSTVMDKKSQKHQVNAQVYNQKDNTVSEHKVLASFAIEKYSKSGFFNIAISPDKSKIAIFATMPFVKKTNEKAQIWVYDNNLNLVSEHAETLSFKSERAYNEAVFVDNSGTVYISKTTDIYKKTRATHLLKYNGVTIENTPLTTSEFQPMHMTLVDVNGQPMLAGFFWNGKKGMIKVNSTEGNDNDGAFLYSLSENKLIGFHHWSESLNAKDLKSLEVADIKVIGDDIFMIGEKRLTKSEFRKVGNTVTNNLDYHYTFGASVIVNMDTKGTLKSFTSLLNGKNFTNEAKEKGSFSALYIENGLHVFTNNNYITNYPFFTDNKPTFNRPSVRPNGASMPTSPYIIPHTVVTVPQYNMAYYIINYGNDYWLTKMTW